MVTFQPGDYTKYVLRLSFLSFVSKYTLFSFFYVNTRKRYLGSTSCFALLFFVVAVIVIAYSVSRKLEICWLPPRVECVII